MRATSIHNRTSLRRELERQRLGTARPRRPGQAFTLPAHVSDRTDAVHVIC
ncbi:hypothetical protein ACIPMU_37140 [Streptomyces cyaneofuscatus]|uniref:hypothetical protein n=1 Tax=Streptomyces cyaneofuscatus TaxID=66883 RepID=UPI003813275E